MDATDETIVDRALLLTAQLPCVDNFKRWLLDWVATSVRNGPWQNGFIVTWLQDKTFSALLRQWRRRRRGSRCSSRSSRRSSSRRRSCRAS